MHRPYQKEKKCFDYLLRRITLGRLYIATFYINLASLYISPILSFLNDNLEIIKHLLPRKMMDTFVFDLTKLWTEIGLEFKPKMSTSCEQLSNLEKQQKTAAEN